MKKYIRAVAVAGVLMIGSLTAAYAPSTRADYYGFISCAERQKLPYMHEALIIELAAFFLLLFLGICRLFLPSCNRIKAVVFCLSITMALNLIALACKILEYPIVLRRNGIFSAVEEGSMRSPLFVLAFIHGLLAIGWINIVLKNHLSIKLRRIGSLTLLLLVISVIIFYIATKPVRCFG